MSKMPSEERVSASLAKMYSITQVDEAGQLFIGPVIHDWTEVERREIDTVIDLEGGLDVGVPTEPEQILYAYFHFYGRGAPEPEQAGRAREPRCLPHTEWAPGPCALRDGVQSVGAGGWVDPEQAGYARFKDRPAVTGAAPGRAVQRNFRQLSRIALTRLSQIYEGPK